MSSDTTTLAAGPASGGRPPSGSFLRRLLRGELNYDYIAHRRFWYALSAALLVLSIGALVVRGLNLGIDFRGGTEVIVSGARCSEQQARDAAASTGFISEADSRVQTVAGADIRLQTGELTPEQVRTLETTLAQACGVTEEQISPNAVGPSWGADISGKALRGLAIFIVLVVAFLSFYFEWKMALAAILALIHDLIITTGIYALVGFEVTPSTVIGLLTVLAYSLYDTVVVFDKVKENTAGIVGSSRMTYSEAANAAVNQTIIRSINTSVFALLPVGGLLFVGAGLLGAGTLKDLALVLFVGQAAGAYSSVFIATPFLAGLKEREPAMQALARRVAARHKGAGDARGGGGGRSAASGARSGARPDARPSARPGGGATRAAGPVDPTSAAGGANGSGDARGQRPADPLATARARRARLSDPANRSGATALDVAAPPAPAAPSATSEPGAADGNAGVGGPVDQADGPVDGSVGPVDQAAGPDSRSAGQRPQPRRSPGAKRAGARRRR